MLIIYLQIATCILTGLVLVSKTDTDSRACRESLAGDADEAVCNHLFGDQSGTLVNDY